MFKGFLTFEATLKLLCLQIFFLFKGFQFCLRPSQRITLLFKNCLKGGVRENRYTAMSWAIGVALVIYPFSTTRLEEKVNKMTYKSAGRRNSESPYWRQRWNPTAHPPSSPARSSDEWALFVEKTSKGNLISSLRMFFTWNWHLGWLVGSKR